MRLDCLEISSSRANGILDVTTNLIRNHSCRHYLTSCTLMNADNVLFKSGLLDFMFENNVLVDIIAIEYRCLKKSKIYENDLTRKILSFNGKKITYFC